MRSLVNVRFGLRIVILALLTAGIWIAGTTGPTPRTVLAAPCCSTCQPDYDACVEGCPTGSAGIGCRNNCKNRRESCHHNCIMDCGGGGSSGTCYYGQGVETCPNGQTCQPDRGWEYQQALTLMSSYCSTCQQHGGCCVLECTFCNQYVWQLENWDQMHPGTCTP